MHFAVVVTTDEEPTEDLLSEILAPYDVNLQVDEYWVEEDWVHPKTKDMTVEERCDFYNREFGDFNNSYKVIDGVLYSSTTYNPLSKWDWWVVGGRWDGYFLHKNGELVNSIQRKDFDAEAKYRVSEEFVRKEWAAWEAAVQEVNPPIMPKSIEHFPNLTPQFPGDHYDYVSFREQPFYASLEKAYRKHLDSDFASIADKLGSSLEEALKEAWIEVFCAYALVHEGEWIGQSYKYTKDQERATRNQISQIIRDLPGDTWMTIVDIHI